MAEDRHRAVQHRSAAPGVEAVTLSTDRSFPRHAHDHLGFGVVAFGAHRSWSGIGAVEAVPGDCIMVNPGEIHDGVAVDGGPRGWRMLFLDPAVPGRLLDGEAVDAAEIVRPVARDPALATLFAQAFAGVTRPCPDPLAAEEGLVAAIAALLGRHGLRGFRAGGTTPGVGRALRRIDDAPEAPTSLAELAALAGTSRFALLRGFKREVGATPHAYLLQRRLRLARRLLAGGTAPAEAAAASGFADQSHLTRAFLRQFGVSPGRYRAALR